VQLFEVYTCMSRIIFIDHESKMIFLRNHYALLLQISCQVPNDFKLLLYCEAADNGLQNPTDGYTMHANQAAVIYVCKDAHQKSEVNL